MRQVKGQVIMQRQDRKSPCAAILITEISVADNRLGISSHCYNWIAGHVVFLLLTCRHHFIHRPHAHCIDVPPLHQRMYIVSLQCGAKVT